MDKNNRLNEIIKDDESIKKESIKKESIRKDKPICLFCKNGHILNTFGCGNCIEVWKDKRRIMAGICIVSPK